MPPPPPTVAFSRFLKSCKYFFVLVKIFRMSLPPPPHTHIKNDATCLYKILKGN